MSSKHKITKKIAKKHSVETENFLNWILVFLCMAMNKSFFPVCFSTPYYPKHHQVYFYLKFSFLPLKM